MVCLIDSSLLKPAAGRTRLKARYIIREQRHKREILVAVIEGHKFAWIWGPEYWDDFLRVLVGQPRNDLPLTEDDVVVLVKLRLAGVRQAAGDLKRQNGSD